MMQGKAGKNDTLLNSLKCTHGTLKCHDNIFLNITLITYVKNGVMVLLEWSKSLHLLQFAFKLKMKDDLLDQREIPTRRRVGIVFSLVKSNHYKFPKNPYYRCMLAWNSLPVDISLLDSKESFTKAVKDTVHNPYIKVL